MSFSNLIAALHRRAPMTFLAALFLLTAGAAPAFAGVVAIPAERDNTLYQADDGSLSNGAGPGLFAGQTAEGDLRRAVLAFDLSSVPPGSMVLSAELVLNADMSISGATDMPLHRLLADWGEAGSVAVGGAGGGGAGGPALPGDATWLHTFFDTGFWTAAGGDFDPTPSAVTPVAGPGVYTWGSTPELVADVQSWVDDPSQNFGWILLGDEIANSTAKRFGSRENASAPAQPQLLIDIAGPVGPLAPEVPALSPVGLGLLMLALAGLGMALLRRRS